MRALILLLLVLPGCLDDRQSRVELEPPEAGADADADAQSDGGVAPDDATPALDASAPDAAPPQGSTVEWSRSLPANGALQNYGIVKLADGRALVWGEFDGNLRFPDQGKLLNANARSSYWIVVDPTGAVADFGGYTAPPWSMVAPLADGGWVAFQRVERAGVLTRHEPAGAPVWSVPVEGDGDSSPEVLAADADGESLVIGGLFVGEIALNAGREGPVGFVDDDPLGPQNVFMGRGFLARLDLDDGRPRALVALGGTGATAIASLAINHGEIALCGGVGGYGGPRTVVFGGGEATLTTHAPDDDPAGDPFLALYGVAGLRFGGAWLVESYTNGIVRACSHLDLPAGHHFGFYTRGGFFAPDTAEETRLEAGEHWAVSTPNVPPQPRQATELGSAPLFQSGDQVRSLRLINVPTDVDVGGRPVRLDGEEDPLSGDLRFVTYVMEGDLSGALLDVRRAPSAFSRQTILRAQSVVLDDGDLLQVISGYGLVRLVPGSGDVVEFGEPEGRALKIFRTRPASLIRP